MPHTQKIRQSVETPFKKSQMLDLLTKDFKSTLVHTHVLTNLKD